MVTVKEAKQILEEQAQALPPVHVSLEVAAGKMLAADIYAHWDIPAFPQSAMDGYAFSFEHWRKQEVIPVTSEVAAGHHHATPLVPGSAVRIFTGAPVPPGADTVVMQEKVILQDTSIIINDEKIFPGANVRPAGSEIDAGALALEKNTWLSPAAIGFLAGIGRETVPVYPSPVISIIVTGKELQLPGQPLAYGQVYESNALALTAALQQLHMDVTTVSRPDDSLPAIAQALEHALEKCDVVLLTGGVSVGDYDFVVKAAELCDITTLFHKVKQKPGKPFYAGKKGNRWVFGLPGNPASALTCFYEYVMPVLGSLTQRHCSVKELRVPLLSNVEKNNSLTQFLKGSYNNTGVLPLTAQESYKLNSFAHANCFIVLDETTSYAAKGEMITIHLLPGQYC